MLVFVTRVYTSALPSNRLVNTALSPSSFHRRGPGPVHPTDRPREHEPGGEVSLPKGKSVRAPAGTCLFCRPQAARRGRGRASRPLLMFATLKPRPFLPKRAPIGVLAGCGSNTPRCASGNGSATTASNGARRTAPVAIDEGAMFLRASLFPPGLSIIILERLTGK
jgi:hypothetical protein